MGTVKVAIPMFGDNVSPRSDCASEMMIVEIKDGKIVGSETVTTAGMNEIRTFRMLVAKGVKTIVGGVMPGFCCRMAEAAGINIARIPSMPVSEIIEILKSGETLESFSRCGHQHRRGSGWGGKRRNLSGSGERNE